MQLRQAIAMEIELEFGDSLPPEAFDLSGTLESRDRQRVELQNIWRKKNGLEPLPLPK